MNISDVQKNTIYKVISGSKMYGFSTENSDTDISGICVPYPKYYLGCAARFEQLEDKPNNTVIFGIEKFLRLAVGCNPNVIEILFIEKPEHILLNTKWGRLIRDNRNLFLSAKAKFTFSGFAISQLHRIKNHRSWLLNPIEKKPTREDFGISEKEFWGKNELNALNKLMADDIPVPTGVIEVVQRLNKYYNALTNYNQYQNWKLNRNPVRAALERKVGYDSKFAVHAIRLLRQGYEILTEGILRSERPDAAELKEIRNGSWSYEKLISYAEEMDSKLNEIYKKGGYAVPQYPPVNKISDLCEYIILDYWKTNNLI